jgi:hypothetical protein
MQRIYLILFLIFLMQIGTSAFGQVPAAPQPVQLVPLVDFSQVFGSLLEMFRPHLASIIGWGLSLLAVSLCMAYVQGILEGKRDEWLAEQKRLERIEGRAAMMEERHEAARLARQREMERSGYVDGFETEYRNRELQNIVLPDDESFVDIEGDHYVRSEFQGYVSYKTLDQWRSDREHELDEPLAFDNNDYGRTYETMSESDHRRAARRSAAEFDSERRHRHGAYSW